MQMVQPYTMYIYLQLIVDLCPAILCNVSAKCHVQSSQNRPSIICTCAVTEIVTLL